MYGPVRSPNVNFDICLLVKSMIMMCMYMYKYIAHDCTFVIYMYI